MINVNNAIKSHIDKRSNKVKARLLGDFNESARVQNISDISDSHCNSFKKCTCSNFDKKNITIILEGLLKH